MAKKTKKVAKRKYTSRGVKEAIESQKTSIPLIENTNTKNINDDIQKIGRMDRLEKDFADKENYSNIPRNTYSADTYPSQFVRKNNLSNSIEDLTETMDLLTVTLVVYQRNIDSLNERLKQRLINLRNINAEIEKYV